MPDTESKENEPEQVPNNPVKNEESAEQKEERQPAAVTITDIELEQLKEEAKEYKDKYLRLLAESENARKRLQKEKQELIQYAVQNVIVDFLNPIDHFENALNYTQQASDEVKHWAIGFQMILNQLKDVLSANGVSPIKSVGSEFDPHLQEAIEMIETAECPPGMVIEECLKGYKMGNPPRTIRPARVKVSKAPAVEEV